MLSRKVSATRWIGLCAMAALAAATVVSAPPPGRAPATDDGRHPPPTRPLVVGINSDFPPFEFVGLDREPMGFDVDVVRAVAEQLQVPIRFETGPWSQLRAALDEGRIDALAGMLFSTDRQRLYGLTHSYEPVNYSIFIRRGTTGIGSEPTLRERKIAVETSSLMHDRLMQIPLDNELVLKESGSAALRAVAAGQAECALLSRRQGEFIIRNENLRDIVAVEPPIYQAELCIAVALGNSQLLAELNRGLAHVRDTGQLAALERRWFPTDAAAARNVLLLRYAAWTVAILLALLTAAMIWMISLRRQVEQRTRSLQAELAERRRVEDALRLSEQRFQVMADSAPVLIWMAGMDGVCSYFNQVWLTFTGRTVEQEQSDGWREGVHPDDRERAGHDYSSAFEARREFKSEYRLRRHDGEHRWMLDHGMPRYDDSGAFVGYIGSCVDITERRHLEQRQRLMMNELDHRVKNNLAAVLALAEQTGATTSNMEEFLERYGGRIRALARTHEALAVSKWAGVRLADLVLLTATPYVQDDDSRLRIKGEEVLLPPDASAPLCMALHELATNAAKYGAWSSTSGQVEVTWSRNGHGELAIAWVESGGPRVNAAVQPGVGHSLISGLISHELRGTVDIQFPPEGLVCRMTMELR